MRPLSKAVIRTGLLDEDQLGEMRRWKLPVAIEVVEGEGEVINDPEMIVKIIQDALESGEQVRVQDTDLDIVQRWVDPKNQVTGKLIMKEGEERATRKLIFCWTVMKEVAFPWTSEGIVDLLCNGETHLKFEGPDGTKRKLYFTDVRELYIGDTKAFVVCSTYEEKT